MKILKIVLGIVLFVILGWIALCTFSDSKLTIEQSLDMDCPPEAVFSQINNFENWPNWSPWHEMDPAMKMSFISENKSGLGAKYSWESEIRNVGTGNSEIVESVINKKVKIDSNFGFGSGNFGTFTLEPTEKGTKVTWLMEGAEMPFFYKATTTLMKGSLVESFEKGLENLSSTCN